MSVYASLPGRAARNGMPTGGGYVYRRLERERQAAARVEATEARAAARDRQQLEDLEQIVHEDITRLRNAREEETFDGRKQASPLPQEVH